MSSNTGVWIYRSRLRKGEVRLVVSKDDSTGHVIGQRQRVNERNQCQVLMPGDTLQTEDLASGLAWLRAKHVQLVAEGYSLADTSGLARSIGLMPSRHASATAAKLIALRQGARRPVPRSGAELYA